MLNSSYLKQEQVRIREQGLGSDILFMAASGAQQHIAGAAGNAQAVMGYPPAAAPPNAQAAVSMPRSSLPSSVRSCQEALLDRTYLSFT
jgi:hypothetical protein